MNKLIFLSLLISSTVFAELSAPLKGDITQFSYPGYRGYYLNLKGDAAKELYHSILANHGAIDTWEFEQVEKGVTVKYKYVYTESMNCAEKFSDLSKRGPVQLKYEYTCQITVDKKGNVQTPARG